MSSPPEAARRRRGAGLLGRAAMRAVRGLARLSPRSPDPDGEVATAVAFLEWAVEPEDVLRAGDGAAAAVALLGLPALALAPPGVRPAVALLVVLAAVGVAYATWAVPTLLATARRTAALGAAPRLVSRAVLRMRVEPTAEAAAAFAARGEGPLAASLRGHVRRAEGTPRTGLGAFAEEWCEPFPALRRAVLLVEAAAAAGPAERERTLDRALDAVLGGTRERAASFAAELRGPATAVYAFGVLLPLALVAVLPAAHVAGLPVGLPVVVAVYDLLLPVGLVCATAWLLARRPLAFPPRRVDRSHPDVPDRRWPPLAAGLGAGSAGWVAAMIVLPAWTRPVAAAGFGAGAALSVHYRPVRRVRERVRDVEAGLADALYLVGRRAHEGTAVERAVELAAEETGGATGEVFAAAARRGRTLRVGVEEAFLGRHGALATVPSPRARAAAGLLAVAAREGRPAGAAVVSMADHLEDLRTVEREARREVRRVTATLGNTAAVFAPLVGGATVALADRLAGTGLGTGMAGAAGSAGPAGSTGAAATATVPTPALGLAVGTYVLVLSVLLTALATGLERGLDRALVGYRAGLALVSATAVYLTAFAAANAVA